MVTTAIGVDTNLYVRRVNEVVTNQIPSQPTKIEHVCCPINSHKERYDQSYRDENNVYEA